MSPDREPDPDFKVTPAWEPNTPLTDEEARKPNAVAVMGRGVNNPTLRRTKDGRPTTTLRYAVYRPGRDEFWNVVLYDELAEDACAEPCKGVLIEMAGQTRKRSDGEIELTAWRFDRYESISISDIELD